MRNRTTVFLVLLVFQFPIALKAETLSLTDYLRQVKGRNQNIQESEEKSKSSEFKLEEAEHQLALKFFTDAYQEDDKRKPTSTFQATETKIKRLNFGFEKHTVLGTTGRLYYNVLLLDQIGVPRLFVPTPKYYETSPVVEISQPLWANSFGIVTRAIGRASEASAQAEFLIENFKIKREMAAAELIFLRLLVARDIIHVQEENFERAKKIRDWNSKRVRYQLADKSDLLQAEAALQLRQLELQTAKEEEMNASRAFNLSRGIVSENVEESLDPLNSEYIAHLEPPKRAEKREDVLASEAALKAIENQSTVKKHQTLPILEIYGKYARTGRDEDLTKSRQDSFKNDYPWWNVGVRFLAPLDFFLASDLREAYRRDVIAADHALSRKLLEQEQEWTELTTLFEQSKRRLKLSQEIEDAQKHKIMHERSRLEKGRSTTYQLLLFEQDYANAQVSRIRTQAEVLQTFAKLKTFVGGTNYESR